jgi:SpoVK/Ycf46/Vps4 family AAA+-type ATPase
MEEIDKAFAGFDDEASTDATMSRIFGRFLTWLQEHKEPVFVVATANNVSHLPPELLRRGRFDELFFVDLPDREARAQILTIHLRKHGRDPAEFPLEALSQVTEHFSGAELEQVIIAGLYEAFAEGRALEARDLDGAARAIVPLYITREEAIKALRDWARQRARFASHDRRVLEFFGGGMS